jgi:sulfotransferase family protein
MLLRPMIGVQNLPSFIVIGTMKGGTTSLYHYVRDHPEIAMPRIKELDFFVDELNWSRGVEWYREQFAAGGKSGVRGEASTSYTKFPRYQGVSARMAKVVPDVRLIYVLRDPVERMRSHYQHRVANGAETRAPEVALFEDPIYLDYSRYALQLDQYLDHFDREQLLVITSEELRDDRHETVHRVFDFIGVDPNFVPANLDSEFYRSDQRRNYPPVVWKARRLIKRRFPHAKRAKELADTVRRHPSTNSGGGGALRPTGEAWLDDAVRARLEAELRADVARLRDHLAPSFDGWGMTADGCGKSDATPRATCDDPVGEKDSRPGI